MHNVNKPDTDNLPSGLQLLKSTVIAVGVAGILLITTVLPGEYGIDPTGVGSALGLTQMGEMKEQLALEAAQEDAGEAPPKVAAAPTAKAAPPPIVTAVVEPTAPPLRSDTMSIKLSPGQGAEIKLEMLKDTKVKFHWTGNGGKVNYDTHGDIYNAPKGYYHGYGKGRFTPDAKGELKAAFDGYHGWFWRNRTQQDLTLTLTVEGTYIAIKRVL